MAEKWLPKVGDSVWCCYDGKFSRRIKGSVVKVRGCFIYVASRRWGGDGEVFAAWFPRRSEQSFGAIVPQKDSLMDSLFGLGGDWYSVYADNGEGDC